MVVATFADAQAAAYAYLIGHWSAEELGPLRIAPWGWESPQSWMITVTNPVEDGVYATVDRVSGEVEEVDWVSWLDLSKRLAKVGDWTDVQGPADGLGSK